MAYDPQATWYWLYLRSGVFSAISEEQAGIAIAEGGTEFVDLRSLNGARLMVRHSEIAALVASTPETRAHELEWNKAHSLAMNGEHEELKKATREYMAAVRDQALDAGDDEWKG